jgi:hypothetical protein
MVKDLDGPIGQRVAAPGDLLAIVPLNLHRDIVGPGDASLDPVVSAAHPAADLQGWLAVVVSLSPLLLVMMVLPAF